MSILQAAYVGKSAVSEAIKLITYSKYSHTAAYFDSDMEVEVGNATHFIAKGSVIEAWKGGVKLSSSLSERHTRGTQVDLFAFKEPLRPEQEKRMAAYLIRHIGVGYAYSNVARFVPIVRIFVPDPPSQLQARSKVYCTQLFLESCNAADRYPLERCEPWEVPPRDPPRSPMFKFVRTYYTV